MSSMETIDTVVIGAGQAGLAVSRCLAAGGREHVVLDRGEVGQRWRDRWQAQRMLTPNWMSRLPFWHYQGDDPDGFRGFPELVGYLEDYASSFDAPIRTGTTVEFVAGGALPSQAAGSARPAGRRIGGAAAARRGPDARFTVGTDRGGLRTRNVIIAAGGCDEPAVPAGLAGALRGVHQLHAADYRGAEGLPAGGVLVVGASSSGLQVAHDAALAGRAVTLSVGAHRRLPRTYRGMDIWWWLERLGLLDQGIDDVPDPEQARREPSLQLVADRDLDLTVLADAGVRLVGRLRAASGHRIELADDLPDTTFAADSQAYGILERIERSLAGTGLAADLADPEPLLPVNAPPATTRLNLRAAGIGTVVWATGYRSPYPWLRIPDVRDPAGRIRQRGGVTPRPGLYVVGLPFLTRRTSHFLDGVRHDARAIVSHLCLGQIPWPRPSGRVNGVARP
jgi:putative flavoprotein involved in K+ transport